MGAVTVDATAFKGPESVASAAAAAKREAKRRGVGLWEIAPLEGDPANVPVPNASLSKSRGAPATSVAPRDPR